MLDGTTRWTVSVSKETDIAVRCFLAKRGMKKGDLSKFIEDAVRCRVLNQTVEEVRSQCADRPADTLEAQVNEAVTETRRASNRKSDKVSDRLLKRTLP